jgi:hypothetical protein
MMVSLISEVSDPASLSLTRPWVNMSKLDQKGWKVARNGDRKPLTSLTTLTKMMMKG